MKFKEFDEEIFKRDTNTTDLTNLEIVDEAITTLQESYFNKIDGFRRIEKVSLLAIHLLQQENKQLKDKINTYENPEDLTLMFMYCDEKAKDKIKQLKEVIEEVRELRDQFIDENELSVWGNDSLINFVNKLLQILDKAKGE